jgi:c-di-GMP-binding flagellar brake protein YcgR
MERRQHPRVDSINLVSLGSLEEDTPVGVARTLMISQGGALLEMAKPYPIHTVFQLDLALGAKVLSIQAEVRHIQARDDQTYRVGIRFIRLEPQDRELLERHLEAKLSDLDGSVRED